MPPVSIRAYGAQDRFKNELHTRLDHYTRLSRISSNLNIWIAVRMDLLGACFTAALAGYLVYGPPVGAANTGFSLNMALDFTDSILSVVRVYNDLEVQANRYILFLSPFKKWFYLCCAVLNAYKAI